MRQPPWDDLDRTVDFLWEKALAYAILFESESSGFCVKSGAKASTPVTAVRSG
jgi:hypothetical protein